MFALSKLISTWMLLLIVGGDLGAQDAAAPEAVAPSEVLLNFEAEDGTALEAKLSLPVERSGPVPVVYYLHGAGARTYDNPFAYVDVDGERKVGRYLDLFVQELTKRGIGFCRMSKRGCRALPAPRWMALDREIFSQATPSILMSDYALGLEELRKRDEIDAARILFVGASEGTWIAPRLAHQSPEGVIGIAMLGYASDNTRDTIVWQNTIGPWRNIAHLIPDARDGELTQAEYDAFAEAEPETASTLPFGMLDSDQSGAMTTEDLQRLNKPALEMILKAVEEGNDEFLWHQLLNLTSAYCKEWWDTEPNSAALLRLDIPLAIFHGELDGSCRVEGVRETEAAFKEAGRDNLRVRIYPDVDHGLNWTQEAVSEGGSQPFRDVFTLLEEWAKAKK